MKRSEKNRMLTVAIESDAACKKLVRQMSKTNPDTPEYLAMVETLNARKKALRSEVRTR